MGRLDNSGVRLRKMYDIYKFLFKLYRNAVKLLKLLYLYVESFCRKWRRLAKSKGKTSFPLTTSTQQLPRENDHSGPQTRILLFEKGFRFDAIRIDIYVRIMF